MKLWDEMQKGRRDWPQRWYGTPDDVPRAPSVELRWFRGRGRWHSLERLEGERLVAACGIALSECDAERSSSAPAQASCLRCLRMLSRLPAGTFTDDALLAKAEQTPRAWLGGRLPGRRLA